MKTKSYIPLMIMAATLLSSCVKDKLFDTPHPTKGAVCIFLEGTANDNYVADIYGQTADITSSPFMWPELINPNMYEIIVYNRADGFKFDGQTARVNTIASNTDASYTSIIPLPGYLKTYCQELSIIADDTLYVYAAPQQRVRDLHIEFTVTQGRPELIQSVTGTLDGIAGAFDMETEQTTGEPVSTVFAFSREGSKLTADLRLLSTIGTAQTLVLNMVFTDGGRTQHTEVDLTEALKDFNGDMTAAYRVTGTLDTPVGMEEVDATITGWETVDGGNVSAEI